MSRPTNMLRPKTGAAISIAVHNISEDNAKAKSELTRAPPSIFLTLLDDDLTAYPKPISDFLDINIGRVLWVRVLV